MLRCVICEEGLSGRQQKYCSRLCHNKAGNNKFQQYQDQQRRGKERKIEAILLKGGRCQSCGYDRNLAALGFHHRDPEKKDFGVDLRKFSNTKWSTLLGELDKCDLLCQNCHMEQHYPHYFEWQVGPERIELSTDAL